MALTIYHNPRCSKSRQTLELLHERGLKPEVIEYLKTPPTRNDLSKIVKMLGVSARDILRAKDAAAAGIDPEKLDDNALIEAMEKNPAIIERPIVVHDGKAALGRPPENVLEIL